MEDIEKIREMIKDENAEIIVDNKKQEIAIIDNNTVQNGLKKAITKTIDDGKDIKDLAKDLTYLKGASDLLEKNDEFNVVYGQELGKQLVQDLKDEGKRSAIINASKKQEAQNLRCKSFYSGCKPIFNLLGIEEPFGLIPMIITVSLLMLPFLLISLIRFVINSINSIFISIASFKKPAFWICTIIIITAITIACVLALLYGIDAVFKTNIFGKNIAPLL